MLKLWLCYIVYVVFELGLVTRRISVRLIAGCSQRYGACFIGFVPLPRGTWYCCRDPVLALIICP